MKRLRSSRRLREAVQEAETITFICYGNIIRSAYAEALLESRTGDRGRLEVRSAGVAAMAGRPADPRAVKVAHERGIDLREHRATSIGALPPARSELVLAMEARHLPSCRERAAASARVFLLGCLKPTGDVEIGDPYAAEEMAEIRSCFDQIELAVAELARLRLERRPASAAGGR